MPPHCLFPLHNDVLRLQRPQNLIEQPNLEWPKMSKAQSPYVKRLQFDKKDVI
jgi:hypothetical protein